MVEPSRLPTVVIVGRPNVGKSTLFNAIIGQRRSIVGDEPGITRDRIYGTARFQRKSFEVIDTGGIVADDDALIPANILKQASFALDEAAQIIFVIDGRTEITAADLDLAKILRRLGKPVTLVVNKIDTAKSAGLTQEFYQLGFQHVAPVSAEHKLGLHELMEHVTSDFPVSEEQSETPLDEADEEAAPDKPARPIRVAIIGRPNTGKSTLLNALTGVERAIVSPVAGTTRDSVDEEVTSEGRRFVFVDTAGIRRKGKTTEMAEKLSVVMARRAIRMAHVVLIMVDAVEGPTAQDAHIAGYAHEAGRPVVVIVNKWDATPQPDRRKYEQSVRDQMKFLEHARVVFISARENKGVRQLFKMIVEGYESASQRVPTSELNRFVEQLTLRTNVKMKYMTQVGIRPPTFIVFTNKAASLHFSDSRFLSNELRRRFGFAGSPIVVRAKAGTRKKTEE
jgi:GTPase